MAAELKLVQPKLRVTIIHSKPQLLSSEPLPDEAKQEALSLIREAGVETVMAVRVTQISEAMDPKTKSAYFIVSLSDGRQMVAGFVINAVSQFVPTSSYLPIDVLDTEGYVKIKSRWVKNKTPSPTAYSVLSILGLLILTPVLSSVVMYQMHTITMRLAMLPLGPASNDAAPQCTMVIMQPLISTKRCWPRLMVLHHNLPSSLLMYRQ